jgi:predicted DNA-binding transcriptional regulator YafY
MSRLERLLNLTAALLSTPRPLRAAEIRARVPGYPDEDGDKASFRRAFERDKSALREMGIPLQVVDIAGEDQPEQGYRIRREDYALRDPGLEPDESAALHLAMAAVRVEGLPGEAALWKLGGPAPDDTAGHAAPVAALPAVPQLVPLFGAVASRSTVGFGYRGATRSIEPWRLSFSRGHWYLDGFDRDRAAARQFRLDRIEGDVEVGAPAAFERPAHLASRTAQPWELGGDDPVVARLAVDADQADWALDQLPGASAVVRHEDGSVEVEVTVTNRDAFRSFVLGFLDHAELLSPPELRDDMVRHLLVLAPGSGSMDPDPGARTEEGRG